MNPFLVSKAPSHREEKSPAEGRFRTLRERWVGFSQFDEAYESTFIAGVCGERFLAHLLS